MTSLAFGDKLPAVRNKGYSDSTVESWQATIFENRLANVETYPAEAHPSDQPTARTLGTMPSVKSRCLQYGSHFGHVFPAGA